MAGRLLNWLLKAICMLVCAYNNAAQAVADPCHSTNCAHHDRRKRSVNTVFHIQRQESRFMSLDPYEERLLIGLVCGLLGAAIVIVFLICCLRKYRLDRNKAAGWNKQPGMMMMGQPMYYPTGYPTGAAQVDPRILDPMRAQSLQSSTTYPPNMYPSYHSGYQTQGVVNSDYANLTMTQKPPYQSDSIDRSQPPPQHLSGARI